MMMMTIIMVTDLFFIWLGSDNSCGQTAAEPKASHSNILTAQCVVAQMLHKMLHMCCIVARLCNTRCTMLYNCCTNVHCPPFWISTALLHTESHNSPPCKSSSMQSNLLILCWKSFFGPLHRFVLLFNTRWWYSSRGFNQKVERQYFAAKPTQSEGGFQNGVRKDLRCTWLRKKKNHACLCTKKFMHVFV